MVFVAIPVRRKFLSFSTYSDSGISLKTVKPSNWGSSALRIALSMILTLGFAIVRGRSPPEDLGISILLLLGKMNDPLSSALLVFSNQKSDIPERVSSLVPFVCIPGLLLS